MAISVLPDVYRGSGWAVAVIAGAGSALQVVDCEYIEHPDTSDVRAAIDALKARPAYIAAKAAHEAAKAQPDYLENEDSAEVRIAGGMMSCTEFVNGMTAAQRKRAGVKNKWF